MNQQDRAENAEQQETYERQMRQHFERDWTGSEDVDNSEYWTMNKAAKKIATALYNPDKVR